MIRKLNRDYINAEISGLSALIESLPEADFLGRMSLESRRGELQQELAALGTGSENGAKIALYFGGEPVIGSVGVQAGFGASTITSFQDLLTKVWAAGTANLAPMGPIPDRAASQLHITSLVHGSFGFLLEELDERGEPLFETPLRQAADRVVGYIASFAGENEASFADALAQIDHRVFKAVRDFFGLVYKAKATFRLVEGAVDAKFDRTAIERAWVRIEASDVDEDMVVVEGRLLGMIPVGRRFEFEPDGSTKIIAGRVGEKFSQSYLERMNTEQFAGRRWKALLHRVTVERKGRPSVETLTLLELDEIDKKANAG